MEDRSRGMSDVELGSPLRLQVQVQAQHAQAQHQDEEPKPQLQPQTALTQSTPDDPPPVPPHTQDLRRQITGSNTYNLIVTSTSRPSSLPAAEGDGSPRPRLRNMNSKSLSFRSDGPLPPLPEDIDINVSPRFTDRAVEVDVDSHPDPRSIPLGLGLSGNSITTRRIESSLADGYNLNEPSHHAHRGKTAGERLDPTLLTAIAEKEKYAFKARMTGFALNAAIGMQVVLGALTTGLSVVTSGRQTQIMTAILGAPSPYPCGLATIVASYLARARGSNEPELSISRVKDLEHFIRECEAFKMDKGHVQDGSEDEKVRGFRRRFEDLLGSASESG